MKKVAILLSTYNGEKYICDQVLSLLNQTYVDFKIYIRDDLSQDNTVSIIENFDDSRIILFKGEVNLGFKQSFYHLVSIVEADIYFFCDQDDVWLYNKLENEIAEILQMDNNIPCLVHSDAYVVDSNLVTLYDSFHKYQKLPPWIAHNWTNLLCQNVVLGCTICFNKKARDLYLTNIFFDIYHDHLISILVSKYGEIRFINKSLLKYRQHQNNIIGSSRFSISHILTKIRNFEMYLASQELILIHFSGFSLQRLLFRKMMLSLCRLFY